MRVASNSLAWFCALGSLVACAAPRGVPSGDTAAAPEDLPGVRIASAAVDLNGDADPETIEIRADVELAADGAPLWEDGHRWVLLVRDGLKEHRLVDEFVPQGRLLAWVVESDSEPEGPVIFSLRESGTTGIAMRVFRYDGWQYVPAGSLDGTGRLVAKLVEGQLGPAE